MEEERKTEKTPQNCKSPMYKFITTIKKCDWEVKKKAQNLIGFLHTNKIDNYNKVSGDPKESTEQVKK